MNNNAIKVDAVVVGVGIMGLMLAKRLLDFGQTVAIIEKSPTIAYGSSSKNHGWIHQGTTHSLSASSLAEAKQTTQQLQYGFNFFKSYAPEAFDEPFIPTYAVTKNADRAAQARKIWTASGVPFEELTKEQFADVESGIYPDHAGYFFRVADGRMNNRLVFMKLLTEIKRKGAFVLTGAAYEYTSRDTVRVESSFGTTRITSPLFFYATGASIDESYQKLMGAPLGVVCYKSHLLYVPRMTNVSVIGLDDDSPIIINHGDISIVNRPHDQQLSQAGDYDIDYDEVRRSIAVLQDSYPVAREIPLSQIRAIACLKPTIPSAQGLDGLRINASTYEPLPGHIFALPGKMTAAPYVADTLLKQVSSRFNLSPVTARPFDAPAVLPELVKA
jgi:glycine/D-amino acid oxidase-like deaminating enzyme